MGDAAMPNNIPKQNTKKVSQIKPFKNKKFITFVETFFQSSLFIFFSPLESGILTSKKPFFFFSDSLSIITKPHALFCSVIYTLGKMI